MNLYFNNVFHGAASDEKFNDVMPILDSFIAGGVSCVLNHGTTRSGKTCTMFGKDGELGLLDQSGEYILRTNSMIVSAFEISSKGCFDLVEKKAHLNDKSAAKGKKISSIVSLKRLIEHINSLRSTSSTNQNAGSSRSHLFIVFSLENSKSNMAFVDLAGFENPNEKDSNETKFINSTLSELNTLLRSVTNKQVLASSKTNKMAVYLKPYLVAPSQTMIFYHINNDSPKKGLSYITDIATSSTEMKRSAHALVDVTNLKKAHRK